jgi:vancomycin resistance protein YoaR
MAVSAASAPYRRQFVGRGSQAIPIGVYRRQQLRAHLRPRVPFMLATVALYVFAGSPWARATGDQESPARPGSVTDVVAALQSPVLPMTLIGPFLVSVSVGEIAIPEASVGEQAMAAPAEVAHGMAYIGGIGEGAITNIGIAVAFIDGAVIQPGERFSFDDAARTWDFNEDPIYVWGTATTTRGIIPMRGGGVCWLSTALWRATLAAGLRTDFRENHYGLIDQLGAGLDATNTLVIRNDAPVAVTIRASLTDDEVHVSLLADEPLDRAASVDGPFPAGRGGHVIYQDVTWADGRKTSSEFVSRYYW